MLIIFTGLYLTSFVVRLTAYVKSCFEQLSRNRFYSQVHCRWRRHILVLSGPYLNMRRIHVQKYSFTFWFEVPYLTHVHCGWHCNIHVVSGPYIIRNRLQGLKRSLKFLIEIKYLANRFCSDFLSKFTVDDNAYISISRSLPDQGKGQGAKLSFYILIEITYLSNRFCSNISWKLIDHDSDSYSYTAARHQGQISGTKIFLLRF